MEKRDPWWLRTFKYATLVLALFVVLFPIYSIVIGAFKTQVEYYQSGLRLPDNFLNFDNFARAFKVGNLLLGFQNILIILVVSIAGNVVLGTMVAYALGRFDFKLRKPIIGLYLIAQVVPLVTTQVATYSVIRYVFDAYNTMYAPILLYLGADVLQIVIYLQFIRNIPKDLDESAMMEGASLMRIYRTIIFPLLGPATATLVILKTISIYNDFYIPYLYMPARKLQVVSTAIYNFVGPNAAQLNVISAGIMIIFIPTVILFLLLQRWIFAGVTSGAIK